MKLKSELCTKEGDYANYLSSSTSLATNTVSLLCRRQIHLANASPWLPSRVGGPPVHPPSEVTETSTAGPSGGDSLTDWAEPRLKQASEADLNYFLAAVQWPVGSISSLK
ncbi:hypothetical protein CDAR_215781 [Caerostris darwini]|uniref:Uncharacterized protein n=1 Tax=Caerostris darwini TaxID=1538125 RepID=A0AAV4MAT0_9ARAC|nr:hypothetical protein CDAR_215781 [Caerostris darwini]